MTNSEKPHLPKKPKIDIAAMDQASSHVTKLLVPYYAAVFRAFLAEDKISREEALRLTIGMMSIPGSRDS